MTKIPQFSLLRLVRYTQTQDNSVISPINQQQRKKHLSRTFTSIFTTMSNLVSIIYFHKVQTFLRSLPLSLEPKTKDDVSNTGVVVMSFLEMVYMATPPTEASALPEDPMPTSSRIKLADGRHLAYRESGVPKNTSNFKIIIVHGFGSSKEMTFHAPQEMIDELGIYFLLYDRAGYGDSDPNPKRSVKSEAFDIEELADQLQLGSKFYVIGVSMGSYSTWSCLKYIPHRLAGVAFVVPVVNYRWPSFPKNLIKDDYRRKLVQSALWIANFAPGLLRWWATQKWLPSTSVMERNPAFFNTRDIDALKTAPGFPMLTKDKLREKKVFDTLHNDFKAAFSHWDFDPMDLSNPFPQNQSAVHIWQGYEDKVVPYQLQRYVSSKLPWIQYHEVPDGGHLIIHYDGLCEVILRTLLLGEESLQYKPDTATIV